MNKRYSKLLTISFFLFLNFYSYSQNSYKHYLDEGVIYYDRAQYQASIALLLKANELKGVDPAYDGYALMYLGGNYAAINQLKKAIEYYSEALEYFETKNKNSESLSFLYERLGFLQLSYNKQYQKAIDYYKKQMEQELLKSDTTNLFDCLNNIGFVYKELHQFDSALHYFKYVVSNPSIHNHSKRKALLLIGDTYSLQKRFGTALYYYDQALPLMIAANDSTEIFTVYLNKGDCFYKQGKYNNSLLYYKKAKQFVNHFTTDIVKKVLYLNLADAYSILKDTSNAFRYLKLETDLNDSINAYEVTQALAEADAKYETRIAKLESATDKLKSVADKRRFYVALIGAIVICLIAFLAFRNAALRKKANTRLLAQKAEVEALADKLEEANQTKARLFSVISHDLRSPVSSLYASLKMQELKDGSEKVNDAVSTHIMHLLDTLEDLLTWSKSQMDRFTLQPVTLRITDMYADLIELHYDAAAAKQISIINKAERKVKVYTDENLLKTILRNVLANSISHAPNRSTVVVEAITKEDSVVCTISNEATATDAAILQARLQTAAIGSSKHGLGNVLIKEFTEKLNAVFEVTYADGKVYLQITVPTMQKTLQSLVLMDLFGEATTVS